LLSSYQLCTHTSNPSSTLTQGPHNLPSPRTPAAAKFALTVYTHLKPYLHTDITLSQHVQHACHINQHALHGHTSTGSFVPIHLKSLAPCPASHKHAHTISCPSSQLLTSEVYDVLLRMFLPFLPVSVSRFSQNLGHVNVSPVSRLIQPYDRSWKTPLLAFVPPRPFDASSSSCLLSFLKQRQNKLS